MKSLYLHGGVAFVFILLLPANRAFQRNLVGTDKCSRPNLGQTFVSVPRETAKTVRRASTLDRTDEAVSSGDDKKKAKFESSIKQKLSFTEQITNSGVASAAAMATAAVNAAVAMRELEAPDFSKSYIAVDTDSSTVIDEDGLPLQYDKDLINKYWQKERGALNKRWAYFVSKAIPFFSRVITLFITEGSITETHIPSLSRQARIDLQDLGPTFIKAGQMMSVRPDVLPESALEELRLLQDSVEPFDTSVAIDLIEKELGGPLGQFFSSISEEPVAAASLAQVYKATLASDPTKEVAIKVQRPNVLTIVSKDLYVLRRAAEVFQGLVERFAPQQKTNYVALLNEFSIGFYTELDFQNEAKNQKALRKILKDDYQIKGITVPKVYDELCTRRILVSEWIDGKKLSECTSEEIKEVTPIAQEAFLVQLFEAGLLHADPHPGNILKLHKPTEEGDVVALIDCGLMASINQEDRDKMISAVIHLANKDYASLVDDFIQLNILPLDSDRAKIIPLMDKALSPYVKGGGAKKYEEELKKIYGMEDNTVASTARGFQAMTQDALTVLNDVPFSIPAYFAILGRAVVTLEGIALSGNENYGIIMESYPFIARKLLREDRPEVQRALMEVLYTSDVGANTTSTNSALKFSRLIALLNSAAGNRQGQSEGGTIAFVDLDSIPENGITFGDGLKFLLSKKAESLRTLLEPEIDNIVDILSRQIIRKGFSEAIVAITPPRPPTIPFFGNIFPNPPKIDEIPLVIPLPSKTGTVQPSSSDPPSLGLLSLKEFVNYLAPKLSRDEEIYAISLADAAQEFFGENVAKLVRGDSVFGVESARLLLTAAQTGALGQQDLLSSRGAKQVMRSMEDVLDNIERQGKKPISSTITSVRALDVLDGLEKQEKDELNSISTQIVHRSLKKAVKRLSPVPRLF